MWSWLLSVLSLTTGAAHCTPPLKAEPRACCLVLHHLTCSAITVDAHGVRLGAAQLLRGSLWSDELHLFLTCTVFWPGVQVLDL